VACQNRAAGAADAVAACFEAETLRRLASGGPVSGEPIDSGSLLSMAQSQMAFFERT
jgi:hypothetical protein